MAIDEADLDSDHISEDNEPRLPQSILLAADQDLEIIMGADLLDSIERTRIANQARLRSLLQVKFGVSDVEDLSDRQRQIVATSQGVVDGLLALEEMVIRGRPVEGSRRRTGGLERAVKNHPFGPWIAGHPGCGEKQTGRLLAAMGGNPYWNQRDDRPRTVGELWAWSGYHVIDGHRPLRTPGQKANWSNTLKSRAFLVAQSCMRAGGEYKSVYDGYKAQHADDVHRCDCPGGYFPCREGGRIVVRFVKCKVEGPDGEKRYAKAGDPLQPSHKHARAMRYLTKMILLDLWLEGRRIWQAQDLTASKERSEPKVGTKRSDPAVTIGTSSRRSPSRPTKRGGTHNPATSVAAKPSCPPSSAGAPTPDRRAATRGPAKPKIVPSLPAASPRGRLRKVGTTSTPIARAGDGANSNEDAPRPATSNGREAPGTNSTADNGGTRLRATSKGLAFSSELPTSPAPTSGRKRPPTPT